MNSTGNDIVSLNAINIARTRQPRFYSKILAHSEIELYNSPVYDQLPLEHYVCVLWSVKESAYKFLQRNNPNLVFSPTKFIVTQLEIPAINFSSANEGIGFDENPVFKGTVTFGSETLYSRSLLNDAFIFSIVNHEDNFDTTCWGIKLIDNSEPHCQSTEVRSFLMDKLNELLPYDNLLVTKNAHGCPILENENRHIPISLAHHEHWIAYSVQLDQIQAGASF